MSEEAREAARRIVAEVLELQQGVDRAVPPDEDRLPAAGPVGGEVPDDGPTAQRARALVAAVFDPPAAVPVTMPEPEEGPAAAPGPEQTPPTAAQRRARALVEEAAAAQEARARRTDEAPADPRTDPPEPEIVAPAAPAEVGLFAAEDPEQPVEDRLFAQLADDEELPSAHHDLPPSLAEDVEGPPPPPVPSDEPPAVVDHRPATVPPAPAAEPPRADLAARLVSEVLEDRGRSTTAAASAPPGVTEEHPTQQLAEEETQGVARWLVVTAIGAVTLALLLPLAVAAVRELLALS